MPRCQILFRLKMGNIDGKHISRVLCCTASMKALDNIQLLWTIFPLNSINFRLPHHQCQSPTIICLTLLYLSTLGLSTQSWSLTSPRIHTPPRLILDLPILNLNDTRLSSYSTSSDFVATGLLSPFDYPISFWLPFGQTLLTRRMNKLLPWAELSSGALEI